MSFDSPRKTVSSYEKKYPIKHFSTEVSKNKSELRKKSKETLGELLRLKDKNGAHSLTIKL